MKANTPLGRRPQRPTRALGRHGTTTLLAAALACAAFVGLAGGCGCTGSGKGRGDAASAPARALPPPDPTFGPAAIDAAIREAWRREGITPAGQVDDAGFLRRAWLDVAGTLPPPETVAAFLADGAPDKRRRAVDALLASPHYADRWTNAWDELLLGPVRSPVVDRGAFRRWLHGQFEANTPWDRVVHALVTATGKNSVGGPRRGMVGPAVEPGEEAEEGVNGAVNWILQYARSPQDLPAAASRVFLGVQIQCAQCHDHKTEKWTQGDFRSFAACFAETRAVPVGAREKGELPTVEVVDGARPRRRFGPKMPDREALQAIAASPPRALDGTDFSNSEHRREALAAWIVSPQNPWFARATVNRTWARLVGRGFVEPVDDMRPGNPGVLPELLDRLAHDFVAHGYDLKHLVRTICATEVYQRAAAPAQAPGGPEAGDALWARFRVRPMSPDVLLDALLGATGLGPVIERVAGERRDQIEAQMRLGFSFLFDVDEAPADASYEGTIPQALFLLNGALGAAGASAAIPGTALSEILARPGGDAEKIEALYLRTLSRRPSPAEIARWTQYVNEPREVSRTAPEAGEPAKDRGNENANGNGNGKGLRRMGRTELPRQLARRLQARPGTAREQAYEDVLWALLNSSEFFFNH